MAKQPEGISFYFFDFDDNVMFLKTPIFLHNKETGEDKEFSTAEFAEIRGQLEKEGHWKNFEIVDDITWYYFRDIPANKLKPGQRQYFVEDVERAVDADPATWQAPSWDLFVYACEKQRPLSIVTARGHSPDTIKAGVRVLVDKGFIEREPNYLSIFPVGNPEVKEGLSEELPKGNDEGDEDEDRTSDLKRIAIRRSVEMAVKAYGSEPPHRFGMSDDDPGNVNLIIQAMRDCKEAYRDKRFFVIDTHEKEWVKLEVFTIDYAVTGQSDDPHEVVQ